MRHIVWDWNGTLFDDGHLVLEGLHAVLDDAGLPRVDLATYQRLYTRPVTTFYERLFGRAIGPTEWEHIDARFHAGYRAALDRAELAVDAQQALTVVADADGTQSLLSMFPHDELVPLVDRLGITPHFARVDGLRGAGGGVKAPFLEQHLAALGHVVGPDRVVVVGDALDDAAAAAQVGVECILYDGGSHPRQELDRVGVPVADTLTEALERAGF